MPHAPRAAGAADGGSRARSRTAAAALTGAPHGGRPVSLVVTLGACVLASFASAAPAAAQTTVSAARPAAIDDDDVSLDDAWLAPDADDALLASAGASLVHDGGPLAPARPMVRGLGGARLGVDVAGLDLADPSTGLVDAAFLPWGAADRLVVETGAGRALAGHLHLGLAHDPGLRARFLAGSLSTVRASVVAGADDALVAVDTGSTRGDFTYLPASPTAATAAKALVRRDNDQARASALGFLRRRVDDVTLDALAFAGGHAGGIAGLAGAPPLHLRGDDGLAGAHVAATRRLAGARLSLAVDARAAHRATFSDDDAAALGLAPSVLGGAGDAVESLSTSAEAAVRGIALVPPAAAGGLLESVRVDVVSGAEHAALLDGRFARDGASASLAARAVLGPLRARVDVDGRALSDAGFLWGGGARVEAGDVVTASLGVARRSRAPTLDELYAPRGLVLGNPALGPETADDVEAALALVPGSVVDARLVGFAGVLEDGIAFVNRDAFSIAPVNLGTAWRAGCDASMSVEPSPWLALDVVAEALWSRVDETNAPLPLAPPFSARVAVRAGRADGARVSAALRARGAAPSNTFGTLEAAPYHVVDLRAVVPLAAGLDAGLAVDNVLDVRDARDANQLPLPGRLVFVSLEVHP